MFKKTILVLCVGLSVSMLSALSAVAKDIDIKLVDSAEAVEYKINEPIAPEEAIQFTTTDYALTGVQILDYGGEVDLMVNSNELIVKRSNVIVVKFAKKQNSNFERQRLVI